MLSPPPKALVLDLFNTVVKWEPARLPAFQWQGKAMHSTMPLLLEHLRQSVAQWDHDDLCVDVYNSVVAEITSERNSHGIEITCLERFQRTLARLPLPPSVAAGALAEALRQIHMNAVRNATFAPEAYRAAVRRLARHFRLALLSNFDDAATGREIIADTGIADLFEEIVISAEVALRKPNPLIFRRILAMMRLEPGEVLFVGDTPHEDVVGAQAAGIPVAWLSHDRSALPEGIAPPALIVPTIVDLPEALGL